MDIMNHDYMYNISLVKGYNPLPPRGPSEEGYRSISSSVHCGAVLWTFTFPGIGRNRASKGEASPQPNNMVLKHILGPATGVSRNKLKM